MIDELNHASSLLDNAIDRYFRACSTIQDYYSQSQSYRAIPTILSQRVAYESSVLDAYEFKLQGAKAKLNWARNCSPYQVPINSLPPEVLVRIFQFALGPNKIGNMYRYRGRNEMSTQNRTSSDVLSHVCSYWCWVALNSPNLWTRIDLLLCDTFDICLLPRSLAFAGRAGSMPLDIHVTDPVSGLLGSGSLNIFIRVVAPRIRSVNLRAYQDPQTDAYHEFLSTCLLYCVPGTLTTLVLSNKGNDYPSAFFDMPNPGVLEHGIEPDQQFSIPVNEAVLLSIQTMRLHNLYPFWTSKAYYGLVELRLTTRNTDFFISESHIRGILRASPGLRILETALSIVDFLPEGLVAPARLDHLEVLNVRRLNYQPTLQFLRIIEPGSRPLQFSLSSESSEEDPRLAFNAPHPFFSRANITTLHLNDLRKDEIVGILRLCPHLRTFAWEGYNFTSEPESDMLIFHPNLRSLFMVYCEVAVNQFPGWIDLPVLEKLVFYHCSFYEDEHTEDSLDDNEVQIELPGINPDVSYIKVDKPNPVDDWELFCFDVTS